MAAVDLWPGIDWDIGVSSSGAAEGGSGGGAGGLSSGVGAEGVVAARLAADGEYRNRLLDDIYELRAFLMQRKTELSSRKNTHFPASQAFLYIGGSHDESVIEAKRYQP